MYVADSLFFLQHIYTDAQSDENHGAMFSMKFREIIENYESRKSKPEDDVEEIKNRMIEKSKALSGKKL